MSSISRGGKQKSVLTRKIATQNLLPGTLAIQSTWELQTIKLSRMFPGWLASTMITFVAE